MPYFILLIFFTSILVGICEKINIDQNKWNLPFGKPAIDEDGNAKNPGNMRWILIKILKEEFEKNFRPNKV